jgi:hypothetical protein
MQLFKHRQSMHAWELESLMQTSVQNAAPQATVSPVQATHSSLSPGGAASAVAVCTQFATQAEAVSIVSWGIREAAEDRRGFVATAYEWRLRNVTPENTITTDRR